MRTVALLVHRYVGLVMAVFLLVAGLTGTVIAFEEELDVALNPALMMVKPPSAGAKFLDPFELNQRLQRELPPGERHLSVEFERKEGRSAQIWVQLEPEKWREYFVNPYDGALLGSREADTLSEGTRNLIPFIYQLHYSLALGEVGTVLFGVVALLWTLDCFVGAYLTLPQPDARAGVVQRRSWFRRWLPAWLVRGTKLFSWIFTWHRASGLWVWAMLLVFAWSAVAFNLHDVYQPVMRTLTGMQKSVHDGLPELKPPYPVPSLDMREAHAVGRRLMAEQARARGFVPGREARLDYYDDHGVFVYVVASQLDISAKHPATEVYFDGQGRFVGFEAPTGLNAANTFSNWLLALHVGSVGGVAYRIFVAVFGLSVALLSVSGVLIWWRKRGKRAVREREPVAPPPEPDLTSLA